MGDGAVGRSGSGALRKGVFQLRQHFRLQPVRTARSRGHADQSYEILGAFGLEPAIPLGLAVSTPGSGSLVWIPEAQIGQDGVRGARWSPIGLLWVGLGLARGVKYSSPPVVIVVAALIATKTTLILSLLR